MFEKSEMVLELHGTSNGQKWELATILIRSCWLILQNIPYCQAKPLPSETYIGKKICIETQNHGVSCNSELYCKHFEVYGNKISHPN